MLETDLYGILSTNSGVLTALGNVNSVYLGMVPKGQPDAPVIVVQNIYTRVWTAEDGPTPLKMKRIQFDSYADDYPSTVALSNRVKALISALNGEYTTTYIQGTILQMDQDYPYEVADTGTGYNFRRVLRFDILHTDQT